MAGKISIPIEFEVARNSAAEVIQTLEKQLQKINPGTAIYDGIKKQITKASGLLEKVDKQFTFGYNTEGDISRTEKDFISLASAVDAVNASFKKIDASALNLNITEGDFGNIAAQLKVVNTNLQQAQSNLQKLQSTKVKDLFDGRETKKISQFTAEQKESSGLAVYEKIGQQMQDIGLQAADAEAKVQQLEKALAALQQTQNKKGYTDASTDAQHASAAKIYGLTGNSNEKVNDVRARVMEELKGAFKNDGSKKSTTDAIVTEILTAFEIDESEITAALTAKVGERQEKLRKIVYNLDESAGQGITSDKVKRARSKTHGMAKEYEGASALQQQIQNTSNELAGAQTESSNFENELASLTAAFQSLREKLYSKNIIGASGTVQDSDLSVEVEQLKAEVEQLQAQLTNQVRAGGGEVSTPTGSSGRANLNSLNETEEFKRSLKDTIKQWMSAAQIVNIIKDGIRQAYSDIQGLDKAMTNIAVVTDMSISDLWGKIDEYMTIAQQYGVTTQGVYEVSQLYYQQGLSTNEVMQATTETLKLARIAGMDYAEAADAMTVAIRSFKMEMSDAATVTDVYSKVAAITASDSEELAIAMSKTASSAESVGSSFENTTAMLAVMIETTRESAQNLGSALKSIISRYGEMKVGLTVDSEGEDIDYNKVDTALKSVGISIKDAQGQFRDFDDVIFELSEKWDSLDKNTQRYIATIMAGNRQQSRFIALVDNWERLDEVSDAAHNAEDAGLLQYAKTLDSLETKINNIKTSFQNFYMDILNGPFIGGMLEGINKVIQAFSKLGAPQTIFNIVMWVKVIKQVANLIISKFGSSFKSIVDRMKEPQQQAIRDWGQAGAQAGKDFSQNFNANNTANGGPQNSAIQNQGTPTTNPSQNEYNPPSGKIDRFFYNRQNSPDKKASLSKNTWGTSGKAQAAGLVLSGVGALASAVSTVAANSSAGWSAWNGAIGDAANYASIGAMAGPWGALVGALLGLVMNIENILNIAEKQRELDYENAKKAAAEAEITKAEKVNEYKSLKEMLDSYNELKGSQYESDENYQAWLDVNKQLAEAYPELISYIDAEGNAIVEVTDASLLLKDAMDGAARASANYYEAKKREYQTQIAANEDHIYFYEVEMLDNGFLQDEELNLTRAKNYTGALGVVGNGVLNALPTLASPLLGGGADLLEYAKTNKKWSLTGVLDSIISEGGFNLTSKEILDWWETDGVNSQNVLLYAQGILKENEVTPLEKKWGDFLTSTTGLEGQIFKKNDDGKIIGWETHFEDLLTGKFGLRELEANERTSYADAIYWQNQRANLDDNFSETVTGANILIGTYLTGEGYDTTDEINYDKMSEDVYEEIISPLISAFEDLPRYAQEGLNKIYKNLDNLSLDELEEELTELGIAEGSVIWNTYTDTWKDRNYKTVAKYGKAIFGDGYAMPEYEQWLKDEGLENTTENRRKYYDESERILSEINDPLADFILNQSQKTVEDYIKLLENTKDLEKRGGLAGARATNRMNAINNALRQAYSKDGILGLSPEEQSEFIALLLTNPGTEEWKEGLLTFAREHNISYDELLSIFGDDITSFDELIYENLNTRLERLREETLKFVEELQDLGKKQKSGFSFEDSQKFLKQYQKYFEDTSWDDLFTITQEGLIVLKNFDAAVGALYGEEIKELNKINEEITNLTKKPTEDTFEEMDKELQKFQKSGNFTAEGAILIVQDYFGVSENLAEQIVNWWLESDSGERTVTAFGKFLDTLADGNEAVIAYYEDQQRRVLQEQSYLQFVDTTYGPAKTAKGAADAPSMETIMKMAVTNNAVPKEIRHTVDAATGKPYTYEFYNWNKFYDEVQKHGIKFDAFGEPIITDPKALTQFMLDQAGIEDAAIRQAVQDEVNQAYQAQLSKDIDASFDSAEVTRIVGFTPSLKNIDITSYFQEVDGEWIFHSRSAAEGYWNAVLVPYLTTVYGLTEDELEPYRQEFLSQNLGKIEELNQKKIDFLSGLDEELTVNDLNTALELGIITYDEYLKAFDATTGEFKPSEARKIIEGSLEKNEEVKAYNEGIREANLKKIDTVTKFFEDNTLSNEEIMDIYLKAVEEGYKGTFSEFTYEFGFIFKDNQWFAKTEEAYDVMAWYVETFFGKEFVALLPTKNDWVSSGIFDDLGKKDDQLSFIKGLSPDDGVSVLQEAQDKLGIEFTQYDLDRVESGVISYYDLVMEKLRSSDNKQWKAQAGLIDLQNIEEKRRNLLQTAEISSLEEYTNAYLALFEAGFGIEEIEKILADGKIDLDETIRILQKLEGNDQLAGAKLLEAAEKYGLSLEDFFARSVLSPAQTLEKLGLKLKDLSIDDYDAYIAAQEEFNASMVNLFTGKGTAADAQRLIETSKATMDKTYQLTQDDFEVTAEGIQLDRSQFWKTLLMLRETDASAYRAVRQSLVENPSIWGEEINSIVDVEERLNQLAKERAELGDEINDQNREQIKLLEEQASIYGEIYAQMSMQKSEGWDFLNNELHGNAENFMSWGNSVRSAYQMVGSPDGFDPKSFINLLTYMEKMGVQVKDTSGNVMAWGSLMEDAFASFGKAYLTGTNIVVGDLGISTDSMSEGMADAVKAMAEDQVKFLDSQILMLEGFLAMQDMDFSGIDSADKFFGAMATGLDRDKDSVIADLGEVKFSLNGKVYPFTPDGVTEAQKDWDAAGFEGNFYQTFLEQVLSPEGQQAILSGNMIEVNSEFQASIQVESPEIISQLDTANGYLKTIAENTDLELQERIKNAEEQGWDLSTISGATQYVDAYSELGFKNILGEPTFQNGVVIPNYNDINWVIYEQLSDFDKEIFNLYYQGLTGRRLDETQVYKDRYGEKPVDQGTGDQNPVEPIVNAGQAELTSGGKVAPYNQPGTPQTGDDDEDNSQDEGQDGDEQNDNKPVNETHTYSDGNGNYYEVPDNPSEAWKILIEGIEDKSIFEGFNPIKNVGGDKSKIEEWYNNASPYQKALFDFATTGKLPYEIEEEPVQTDTLQKGEEESQSLPDTPAEEEPEWSFAEKVLNIEKTIGENLTVQSDATIEHWHQIVDYVGLPEGIDENKFFEEVGKWLNDPLYTPSKEILEGMKFVDEQWKVLVSDSQKIMGQRLKDIATDQQILDLSNSANGDILQATALLTNSPSPILSKGGYDYIRTVANQWDPLPYDLFTPEGSSYIFTGEQGMPTSDEWDKVYSDLGFGNQSRPKITSSANEDNTIITYYITMGDGTNVPIYRTDANGSLYTGGGWDEDFKKSPYGIALFNAWYEEGFSSPLDFNEDLGDYIAASYGAWQAYSGFLGDHPLSLLADENGFVTIKLDFSEEAYADFGGSEAAEKAELEWLRWIYPQYFDYYDANAALVNAKESNPENIDYFTKLQNLLPTLDSFTLNDPDKNLAWDNYKQDLYDNIEAGNWEAVNNVLAQMSKLALESSPALSLALDDLTGNSTLATKALEILDIVTNSTTSSLEGTSSSADDLSANLDQTTDSVGNLNNAINNVGGGSLSGETTTPSNGGTGPALAEGNVSLDRLNAGARLAGKTLVGELGPELAVYDGMYHLLGQNGAEFVNLPSDAIVFNHKQTAGIIKGQGGYRGHALAEGNADELIKGNAYAEGHITGPALADANATLDHLKRLRAMWQEIANMSAEELAGIGGGGGGGGGGNSLKAITSELEEWYNLSRQIENLEQEINNLLAERDNIAKDNGEAYLRNLRETQKLLQQQKLTQQILLDYQMKQLDRQREHINSNSIWSKFLTVDENGLLQYEKGNETNGGKGSIKVLQDLNAMSAEEQIKFIEKLGYSYKDNEGKDLEGSELVSKFYEELQEQIDQYDELYDTVNGTKETIEQLTTDIEAINQEIIDNQKELEQNVYDILVEAWEKEIEALEEQTELIEEANKAYVEGLRDALNTEKDLYEENNSIEERESLQRQLSLLRRSGGSASEIADLEEQLNDTLKDEYFRNQEKMIKNIEDANEEQVKKLEEQITLQKEALEYQKENGVLWTEVYKVLAGTKEDILAFMQGKHPEFFSKSALQQEEMLTDWAHKIGIYTEERQYENYIKAATSIWDSNDLWNGETLKGLKETYDGLSSEQQEGVKSVFTDTYVNSMINGADETEARLKAERAVGDNLGRVYKEDGSYEDTGVIGGTTGSGGSGEEKRLYYGGYTEDGTFVGGAEKFVYGNEALARQFASDPTRNTKVIAVNRAGYFKTSSSPVEAWKKWYIEDGNGNKISATGYDTKEAAEAVINKYKKIAEDNQKEIAQARAEGTTPQITPLTEKELQYTRAVAKLYSKGGLVDYTGVAIVHGSKSKPEAFLNAAQTAQIKEALQATNGKENLLSGLHSTIAELRSLIHNISTIDNSTNNSITIAPGAVVINVDQLADSYDVDALSADIMNRMVSIASKATNRGVNRR